MSVVSVKILNTLLSGCEYNLTEDTLFITSNESVFAGQQSLVIPDKSIVIPCEQDGDYNFLIKFPSADNENYRAIITSQNINDENKCNELILLPQTVYEVGQVKFAIKPADEEWRDDLGYEDTSNKLSHPNEVRVVKKTRFLLIPLLFLLIALLGGIAWYILQEPQRRLTSVSSVLYPQENYTVLLGKNDVTYVFAHQISDFNWAQQILKKYVEASSVRILDVEQEKRKILSWLSFSWPNLKMNSLNMESAATPLLALSKERGSLLNTDDQNRLRKELLERMPYAKNIAFSTISDDVVIDAAKSGLQKYALNYVQDKQKDSMTFILKGSLDDTDLQNIKMFINSYYQKWGDSYVKFIINLDDDFIRKYTIKTGTDGYVKFSSNHWFIPNN